MPIYEFVCESCGHEFEQIVPFSATAMPSCPACQSKQVHRQMSRPAIHFKGSGWYITDSKAASKGSANGSDTEGTAKKESGTGDESKSESKSESNSSSSDGLASGSEDKGRKQERVIKFYVGSIIHSTLPAVAVVFYKTCRIAPSQQLRWYRLEPILKLVVTMQTTSKRAIGTEIFRIDP
ncbi:MAG: zinc ribbon domain-containing protein [Caldilineaceae bacterium]